MGSYSRAKYVTQSTDFPRSADSKSVSASYATFADLPASSTTIGNTAFVVATNKLYIWSGVGWYLVAEVTNASPSAISGVDGAYSLAIDGTATTITAVSTDPEGFALTWSYAVSSGSLGSTATVAQTDNVFTITPSSTEANAGTFSLTFSVTDGLNGVVSAVSAFTLEFSVANSRYTALSVKATGTGSNQTFDDASTLNNTITVTGNSTASTVSPYRHGGYATYFDGNDRIDISTGFLGSHTTGNASTSTFTIESWVYQEARGSNNGIDGNAASIISKWVYFNFGIDDSGHLHGHHYSGSQHNLETTATVPLKTWTHVALVVTGAQIKLYINGTLGATGTWYGMQAATALAGIGGSNQSHPEKFTGYMHDIRVSDNARYTTNFTPADALTTDSNTDLLIGKLQVRDLSSNSEALTLQGDVKVVPFNTSTGDNDPYSKADHGASVYFDGTGDYISAEDDASFSFGTGDFTVECWLFHQNASALYYDLIGTASNANYIGANRGGWIFGYYHTHSSTYALKFGYQYNNTFVHDISFSKTLNADTWYHIALTRQGNQLKYFVDGIQVGSTVTNSTNIVSTEPLTIGTGATVTSQYVTGYMSDVRVVKGTAVYTSNFTPPTEPLTAITNTKFLLNPETSISDLSQSSTITCLGNTATSTTQAKFSNTRSIYGDGSGDYVSMPIDPIGTDDFTVEAWIYPTSMGSTATAISGATIGGAMGVVFRKDQWFIGNNTTNQTFTSAANKFVINQWQHIAMTRQGTSVKLFYNGTLFDSGTNSYNLNQTKYVLYAAYTDGSYLSFAGHIQDFRITKGLARYTANFTPPTAELQG